MPTLNTLDDAATNCRLCKNYAALHKEKMKPRSDGFSEETRFSWDVDADINYGCLMDIARSRAVEASRYLDIRIGSQVLAVCASCDYVEAGIAELLKMANL